MKRFAIPLLAVLLMTTVVVLSLNNQGAYQSDLNASSEQIAQLERGQAQSSSLEGTSSSELPDQEASSSEQASTASQESAAPSLAESSSSQSVREQQSSAAQQPSEQQKVTSSSSAKPEQRPARPAPSSSAPVPSVPSVPSAPESSRPSSSKPEADNNTLSYAQRVVQLVNQEREKAGLQPLSISQSAEAAALIRAKEIEDSFSHTRPNGSSFYTALKEQGVSYRSSGENIAWGQKTPEQVMQGWMNSPGHRANILNANFTAIGVGYYRSPAGVNYWTQLFIG